MNQIDLITSNNNKNGSMTKNEWMNVKQPKIALTHENFSQQSPAFRQSVGANA